MDTTTAFDRRLDLLPLEWKWPLVNVMDTAGAVRLQLREWGLESDAAALVGLTALVLEERRRIAEAEAAPWCLRHEAPPLIDDRKRWGFWEEFASLTS